MYARLKVCLLSQPVVYCLPPFAGLHHTMPTCVLMAERAVIGFPCAVLSLNVLVAFEGASFGKCCAHAPLIVTHACAGRAGGRRLGAGH